MDHKTDVPGVYKPEDGILINKDSAALKAYKERKKREQKLNTIDSLQDDINSLKSDMDEIKNLLKGLLSK